MSNDPDGTPEPALPHPSAAPPPSPKGRREIGNGTLLVRADGNERIGAGHVVRCLSLAEAWRESGGSVHFVCRVDLAPRLHQRIVDQGNEYTLLPSETLPSAEPAAIVQLAEKLDAVWIVLDSYEFDPPYQRAVQATGRQTLVIDDDARWPQYHADLLLNQNPDAESRTYPSPEAKQRLLGSSYALVGSQFRRARRLRREIPDRARHVLVTLGGADSANLTSTVLAAIQQVSQPLEVRVLVGPAKSQAVGERQATVAGTHSVTYLVDPPDVTEQFAWADIAVSAAGSTCWELATIGVPAIVIPVAENQQAIAKELAARGVVVNAGAVFTPHPNPLPQGEREQSLADAIAALTEDRERRQTMSARGRELIDGLGTSRVVAELWRRALRLRPVTVDDAKLIWQWANDTETRAASFRTPKKILWSEHEAWFTSKLVDPDCKLWLGIDARGRAVGVVRYELAGREGVLSINIASNLRGAGHGGRLVRLSARRWFHETPKGESIRAFVKPNNFPSQRMFTKAGFLRDADTTVADQPAMTWILERGTPA